jgi:hypothetical protein
VNNSRSSFRGIEPWSRDPENLAKSATIRQRRFWTCPSAPSLAEVASAPRKEKATASAMAEFQISQRTREHRSGSGVRAAIFVRRADASGVRPDQRRWQPIAQNITHCALDHSSEQLRGVILSRQKKTPAR